MLAPARPAGIAAAGCALAWATPDVRDAFAAYQWWGLGIGAGVTLLWYAGAVSERKTEQAQLERLQAVRDRYVLTETFTAEARALFSRGSLVASAVLTSAVNKQRSHRPYRHVRISEVPEYPSDPA